MERRAPGFSLITQNVDGLHRRAGSEKAVELHGNIMRSKCSVEDVVVEPREDDEEMPPSCPNCGALLRPDVVWFGEMLPAGALEEAYEAARACDVFFSIGTSAVVQPTASLAFEAQRQGAVIVEVNPNDTPLTGNVGYALRGKAGEILPDLVKIAYDD